jgi:hypothetical protein
LPRTKRFILRTLEVGAASTEEFERMYRRAYGMKASLADPLAAGLNHHTTRAELSRLIALLKLPPSPRKDMADELIAYGRSDDAFWLDPAAAPAAKKDAEAELVPPRAWRDGGRDATRCGCRSHDPEGPSSKVSMISRGSAERAMAGASQVDRGWPRPYARTAPKGLGPKPTSLWVHSPIGLPLSLGYNLTRS